MQDIQQIKNIFQKSEINLETVEYIQQRSESII